METHKNYTFTNVGSPSTWSLNTFPLGELTVPGKRFLQQEIGSKSCEISINSLQPGEGMPFKHRHRKNEEIYVFLNGRGKFVVDQDQFPVKAGTVIRVDPEGERAWINDGDEELRFLVIQVAADSKVGPTVDDGEGVSSPLEWV